MTQEFGPTGPVPDGDATQPVPQHWSRPSAMPTTWNTGEWGVAEDEDEPERGGYRGVVMALAIGSLVMVTIGVYGKVHEPTNQAFSLAGFSTGLHAKTWLGTIAFVLAVVQVVSSLAMWGRLPGVHGDGRVAGILHRWSGRLAVLVSLPVAAHCLYALGFQGFDTRVLVHSLLGCFFYGVFVCKMIVLTKHDKPAWLLPVVGGVVFTGLTGLWLTSSVWFFTEYGVSF
ncbi:DUF6529 family protein [Actinophytocola xinjiangensis]|nr:DUF6529 family protein [Actinophytocola xinjiangensis]